MHVDHFTIFLIGLLGSMHCIGMCGGFVAMYSLRNPEEQPTLLHHALFNLGRISTYSLLGGLVGYLGSFSAYLTPSRSVPGAVLLLAGGIMVLMGLNMLGVLGKRGWFEMESIIGMPFFRGTLKAALDMRSHLGLYLFGVLLGFLPCGLLYPMLIQSAISGGYIKGIMQMAIFGAGTVPALMSFGMLMTNLQPRLRNTLFRIASGLIVLLGFQAVMRGMVFYGWIPPSTYW